ncbi:MAG: SAM-dependent methyltransferase [Bryobacteraceae bacterium]|nr:SAM-dependent methyltransferase [Bryobacteraceae bacterium]
MNPVARILREEIARTGPIAFHRFMDVALYHPEHGYYRRGRDPFGKQGDYYTAEQLQPVFGILIASQVRELFERMGRPEDFTVLELGPGRGEMAEFFSSWRYVPVEAGDEMPSGIAGVVFANEFFDALPVHVAVKRGQAFRAMLVGNEGGGFRWVEGEAVAGRIREYLEDFAGVAEDGAVVEVHLDALEWIAKVAQRLTRGYLLAIDYGYTARELARFPAGTLMSYRRHAASEDVLADPGSKDITAHAPFTALERHALRRGFDKARLETLASLLLRTGERDQFAEALDAAAEAERLRRRLQLKSLLFGMGESFRALLLEKRGEK